MNGSQARPLGVRSIDDARKTEIVLGATGPASGTMLYPLEMNSILGTRFKVIPGYKPTDTLLAVERGETNGAYSSLTTIRTSCASCSASTSCRWIPSPVATW